MNRTFRVVFNRARGALMVANELTASVRSKGTKTVVAAAVAAVAGSAFAADYVGQENPSGGAISLNGETLLIQGDYFEGNEATGTDSIGHGGAIRANGKGSLSVEATVFKNNSALRGGAVANTDSTPLYVRNSRFEGNKASQYGGALYQQWGLFQVENSVFVKNSATLSGGAIGSVFNMENTVEISASRFEENTALLGGAMAIYYGIELDDTVFVGNHTTGNDDGGGAIVFGGHGKADIKRTRFERNAANMGGALSTRPANGQDVKDDGHWLHVADSVFTGNTADAGELNGVTYDQQKNAMFHGDGGAVWNGMTAFNPGNDSEENRIVDSTFEKNVAKNNGGALYNQGNLRVGGTVTFSGNEAKKGGAVYTDANDLTLDATAATDVIRFTGNKASVAGSDLYVGDLQRTEEKWLFVHLSG